METSSPGPPLSPSRKPPVALVITLVALLLAGVAAFFMVRPHSRKAVPAGGDTITSSIPAVGKAPDEVLDEYLRYRLVERSDIGASRLICQKPDLADVDYYVADIKNRESQFHITINSTWGPFTDHPAPDGGTEVRVDLTRTVTDQASSSNSWVFVLSDDKGWKVCSGHAASAR